MSRWTTTWRPRPGSIGPCSHSRMLCGDWEAARAMAADADVLGWSSSNNPQGVVVPACLVLLSGQATAPPANLARLWDWALESSTFLSAYDERPEDQKRRCRSIRR